MNRDFNPTGIVFDIAEGSIHDGPGLRITVFMKGCPMRCAWCHSPEGQNPRPEWLTPMNGIRRLAGETWHASGLADYLNSKAAFIPSPGGVTFSGGEPLAQAPFVLEVMRRIPSLHKILDTAACGDGHELAALARQADLVHWGVKVLDSEENARRRTGAGCGRIIENIVRADAATDTPSLFRIPLLPGVTDTPENLAAIASLATRLKHLQRVEFLSANPSAGAKYEACHRHYEPGFEETAAAHLNAAELSARIGLPVHILDRQHLSGAVGAR